MKKLVEKLFEDCIYSKVTSEAKLKLEKAFEDEYEQLCGAHSDVEAMGLLMSRYGTVEKAGELAGYTEEEIEGWKCTEDITSHDTFSKLFRKTRMQMYLFALLATGVVSQMIDLSIYHSVVNIVSVLESVLLCVLFGRFLWKRRNKGSYDLLCFDGAGRQYIEKYSDRYTKRLINSIYITVAGTAFAVFLFGNAVMNSGATYTEALTSILTGMSAIQLVAYSLFKNILCRYWLGFDLDHHVNEQVKQYAIQAGAVSVIYWLIIEVLLFGLNHVIDYPFNYFIAAMVCFGILVIISNLTIRQKIVFQNVRVNIRRSVVASLCIILILSYQIMKMDSFLLQPYISRVANVYDKPDAIAYDDASGTYTITSDKEDFKILQLTDIHLGGSPASVVKDYKALQACSTLIDRTQPDLVVVTGDLVFPVGIFSFSFNNTAPIIEFSNFMRNKGVPWAFLYGNHDTEVYANGSVEEVQSTLESLSFKTSGNLLYPYVQPNITGRNNQLIELRNEDGTLNQALVLLDSNDYVAGLNDYDYIHDDEVEWYQTQIEALNQSEGKTVSSLLFFHMPLQQYKTAYELHEQGSSDVKYYFGENKEKMLDKVCSSKYPSKLFDTAKELGSTKAMFCGHDHYNNLSVEYEGIRLTYGMSIDYLAMPGIDEDTEQRGGTLITCHKDSTYDITQVKLN